MWQSNVKRRAAALFMIPVLIMLFMIPVSVETSAGTLIPANVNLSVDGGEAGIVRALNVSYFNNTYISLRDTAVLLSGSSRQFNAEVNGGSIVIKTGEPYSDEFSHTGYEEEKLEQYSGAEPAVNPLTVNDEERRYFTLIVNLGDHYDCFISPMDLGMIIDADFDINESGIKVNTSEGFKINPARMEAYGFFDGVNTVVVGDATTGEVFYAFNPEEPQPIASTTKLMTYLVTMDAVSAGKITLEDTVTISAEAARLSASQDGSVALKEGWEIPVAELIIGALLPSSNECALTLAEYVGGSEEEFVKLMNEEAENLSLSTAMFYNSNGLPIYTDNVIAAKTQNKMSGYDMFRLCAHIVTKYPMVKDITSQKRGKLPSLGLELKNTNGLLYNLPEVNGLKTGTTDKSGACLVTSLTVQGSDGPHDLIVVVLGAENSQGRLRVSELMARYGRDVIGGKAAKIGYALNAPEEGEKKLTAEVLIKMVVDHALNSK
ncbi:MAG: serine hydrolase [Lachnospiraceae bacterium]|nr:serine hydrolase [Lachnospiraceae bacterium]